MIDYAAARPGHRPQLVRPRPRPAGAGATATARPRTSSGRRPSCAPSARSWARPSPPTPTSSTPTRPSSCATTAGPTRSNEVVHHPATLDSKQALWESGLRVGGFAADEADARPARARQSCYAATSYLLSQADTGLVCSLGMTAASPASSPPTRRPTCATALLAGLRADDLDHGLDGSMFLTERDGGSDLGRTVHCTRARHRRRSGAHRRREVVLLEHRRRRHRDAGPARGRARRAPPGSASTSCPAYLDDGSPQRHHDAAAQAEAGHEERADRRGRVPRRARVRPAPRARRRRAPAAPDAGGLEPHDGDGQRLALRRRHDGPRHRPPQLPRGDDLGAPPQGQRALPRRPPARCASSSSTCSSSSRPRSRSASSAPPPTRRADGERLRRILVPAAKVRLCRFGVEAAGVRHRAPRRQRLLRGLGPHPPAPRRAVPPDLGGQREHLRPRRAPRHPARRGAPRGVRPDRRGAGHGPASGPGLAAAAIQTVAAARGARARASTSSLTRRRPRRGRRRRGSRSCLATTVERGAAARAGRRRPPQGAGGAALRPPSPQRRRLGRPHRRGLGRDILAHADISEAEAARAAS